jgi:hypothetical protein
MVRRLNSKEEKDRDIVAKILNSFQLEDINKVYFIMNKLNLKQYVAQYPQ